MGSWNGARLESEPDCSAALERDTRQRLLEAAIDIFGRHGFEGTSTRSIARKAGANLQSIAYYFGNKEGLYIAAADYIGSGIAAQTAELRTRIGSRLDHLAATGDSMGRAEAVEHLYTLATFLVRMVLSSEMEPWARFIVREQMEPSEAFRHLYQHVMGPVLDLVTRLMAILLQEADARAEYVRLRALAFMGSVLIFRFGQATVLKEMGRQSLQGTDLDAVCGAFRALVESLHPAREGSV